ncbi:MAG: sodium/hydrogen exchanger [Candidatus Bathyarchaeota archaeon B23]|nr:MAG: sodium/hydrogen exchanger [Candidatus Bathyarchaeota archaeon B23]
MIEPGELLILISSTLFLSYLSGLIYDKTKIPDVVWLLGFGLFLGPALHLLKVAIFQSLSPLMCIVALIVILFDAGINVDVREVMETMDKAVTLCFTTFTITLVTVGVLLHLFMPDSFTTLQAMLFASMVGGTSTVSVLSILANLERLVDMDGAKVILMMESVISDPLCIITSMTLIKMIMMRGVSPLDAAFRIIITFSASTIIGFVAGVLWAKVLHLLRGRPLNYIMTMAALFPLYLVTESFIGPGGGPVSALTFGLAITNFNYIFRSLGLEERVWIDKYHLREFHEEITFFIKSFFFVFIGLISQPTGRYITIGLLIVLLLALIRLMAVKTISKPLHFTKTETILSALIFANGLPALVMSQLPHLYDPTGLFFQHPDAYTNLCLPIVLGTILFGALLGPLTAREMLKRSE